MDISCWKQNINLGCYCRKFRCTEIYVISVRQKPGSHDGGFKVVLCSYCCNDLL